MALPVDGQLNWGDPLNSVIEADETSIAALQSSVASHEGNVPPDPHGDRAYASNLVAPIFTGINGPNGFVRCGPNGQIPLGVVPTGAGLTNWIDAIPDFNVPINGVSDASAALNAALTQTNQNGGGIVYVGNGQFALANSLVIGSNTWLISSPGAIFTRINSGGPGSPCFSMIRNYGNGILPQNGNIRITGGTWDIALSGHNGAFFTFANADFITIDNLTVAGQPDGFSPIGRLFGCSNVTVDNVEIISLSPTVTGRSNQHVPCFHVEECNSANNTTFCTSVSETIPTSFLLNNPCSDIKFRGVNNRCGTLNDDNDGPYGAWTSFCGTKGTVTTVNLHANIVIQQCFGSGFAVASVETLNWSNLNCAGNFFSYPASPYSATWYAGFSSTQVQGYLQTFIFDTNSPRCYSPLVTNNCTNTVTETIVAQFQIAANDYLDGSTCYDHRHSGLITTATASEQITITVYVGPNGNLTDTITQQFTLTLNQQLTNAPYCLHHRGFDIDPDGHFNDCGTEFKSQCYKWTDGNGNDHHSFEHQCKGDNVTEHRVQPDRTKPCYVTHTVKWNAAKTGNNFNCRSGYHDRRRV